MPRRISGPLTLSLLVLLTTFMIGGCTPAASEPRPLTAAEIAKGKLLYATNGCAACHGPEGHGDGQLARTLTPPPRDFRRRDAFKLSRTVPAVAEVIARGISAFPTPMPAFAHLDLDSRELIAAYVLVISGALEHATGSGSDETSPENP